MGLLLIISITVVYVYSVFYFVGVINKTTLLSPSQKKFNIIMIVMLPLVWGALIYSLFKTKTGGSHDPKNRKERDFNRGYGENHPTD